MFLKWFGARIGTNTFIENCTEQAGNRRRVCDVIRITVSESERVTTNTAYYTTATRRPLRRY